MGTSPQQVEDLMRRFAWAEEASSRQLFGREQPQHEVTLRAFEIGRYPVLNVEYAEFVRAAGAKAPLHWPRGKLPEEMADHPVVNVSWQDALGYVQWLAERTGKPYRLPTEAEWEKAARGDEGWLWPWGNDWDPARVNCKPDGPGRTSARGQYSPAGNSPYGCADMAGNVWEWCSSIDRPYRYTFEDGRENPLGNERRILRGGSWNNDNPNSLRCAYRSRSHPSSIDVYLGFRVAKDFLG
jgi:formylglycine-generating enzyme required for sulfatase activity